MINKIDTFKGGVLNSIRPRRTNMAEYCEQDRVMSLAHSRKKLKKYAVGA